MRRFWKISGLAVLGALVVAGCEDGTPAEPAMEQLSLEDQLTLELLADPGSGEAALDLLGAQTMAAHRRGHMWGQGPSYSAQAQMYFQQAEEAFAAGRMERALEQARMGRQMIAAGMEAAGGPWAVEALIERLEALPVTLASDPGCFQNAEGLGLQLGQLAQHARNAFHMGRKAEAGQLGVLGEQAVRHRIRDHDYALTGTPEIWVGLGASAVELAGRLIQAGTPDQEQLDLLAAAEEFERFAREALEAGELRRAVHFAHQAVWWSLKAVVVPGGITDEEARALVDLAETLLDDARAAVGSEPTELQERLLLRASTLLEAGKAALSNGTYRGLGAIWQSAVTSNYLIG